MKDFYLKKRLLKISRQVYSPPKELLLRKKYRSGLSFLPKERNILILPPYLIIRSLKRRRDFDFNR